MRASESRRPRFLALTVPHGSLSAVPAVRLRGGGDDAIVLCARYSPGEDHEHAGRRSLEFRRVSVRFNTRVGRCAQDIHGLLPAAFSSFDLLSEDVLWRKKEAFSDGVSAKEESWFSIIQRHIEQVVLDEEMM